MTKIIGYLTIFLILAIGIFLVANNQAAYAATKGQAQGNSLAKAYELMHERFDGNTIASWVRNNGNIVDYHKTGGSGMEWPKGSGKTIDFQSGLWLAGKDQDGTIRTACAEYASEFLPGVILPDGTPDNPDDPKYRIYKINSDGSGDWDSWPFDQGAPAQKAKDGSDSLDANGNKVPLLLGDQTLWFVMNDAAQSAHANLFSTKPMGVEEQVMIFGYNTSNPLGNIMFIKWTIINKSPNTYDSCFVAIWDDPDLGDASDDLVGSDTTLSLGYCYNGGPVDATYGTTPPAIGFDFFQGPEVPKGSGNYLPMSSFVYYWNGAPDPYGDPEDATQMYNFMRGFASDGSPYTDDAGKPSKFVFSGDPASGSGWLDSSPGDRRFLMSSGPFTLAPGDTQIIVGAKIIAPGTDNLAAVTALRFFDSFAQNAFDNNFELPKPPVPVASAINLDGKIVLDWQDDNDQYKKIENYNFSGYNFEGYNVYQGESPSGPWKRIATFDKVSDFGIVFDNTFDPSTGMVLNQPVAFGANTGITRNLTVEMDKITGLPLYNYKSYYFAVTAYAINPDVSPKVVESGKVNVTAMPSAKLDIKPNAVAGEIIEAEHIAGKSDGSVKAAVIDPSALTGHTYQVTFDTLAGSTVWNLIDLATNEKVLENQTNQSGDEDYMIVQGMKVYVAGPPLAIKDWDYDGPRWVSGVNWGGRQFFGGMDLGSEFFGSTLGPADYVPIELRWAADTTSGPADGWASKGYVYWRDQGYGFAGVGYLPFSAWDISDPANPRQVNVCFVENIKEGGGKGNHNLRWDMGGYHPDTNSYADGAGLGGREYIFIMRSDYDASGSTYNDDNWGPAADVLYAIWPKQRGSHPWLEGEFTMTILPNYVNTSEDVFQFATKGPSVGAEVAKIQMEKINVVPNPYFGWNPAETIPTNRIMRFTNLSGDKVTIRIFDLAGNLVRVIDDQARATQGTLGTAYAEWDLRNSSDVPVASGMYLAYIEVEGVGSKVLKIAIINREERLLYY